MTRKIIPLLIILLLSGCAVTHNFGPYQGQVVDKETGEPIAGAVVFLRFFTYAVWTPAGRVDNFADAIEVLTDKQGRFEIEQKVFSFRPGSTWAKKPKSIVFKPGYGVFPKHPETSCEQCNIGQWLTPQEMVTIKLPKLNDKEERLRNIGYATYDDNPIPMDKQKMIFSLTDEERISLGLQPRIVQ